MNKFYYFCFIIISLFANVAKCELKYEKEFIDLTLIGAYGNLAKKYLWKGLFDLFLKYETTNEQYNVFNIYGCGTANYSRGSLLLKNTLNQVSFCEKQDTVCMKKKLIFLNGINYQQLASSSDYQHHCEENLRSSKDFCSDKSSKRCLKQIFYLSVPPFAYESISGFISSNCRTHKNLQIIIEKPFGNDLVSAVTLAKKLSSFFREDEIYRVDHYMGKQAVQAIDILKKSEVKFEQILNREFVEKIEIIMKEHESVKGRTKFYDSYGVVNDVMQNHLSEVAYKILRNPLKNSLNDDSEKVLLQKEIEEINKREIVCSQYEGYEAEVQEETKRNQSLIPTFAAAVLRVSSVRWNDVPVFISAGKMLDEKVGYARIVFKNNKMSLNYSEDEDINDVIFYFGHGILRSGSVLISKNLNFNGDSLLAFGWKQSKAFDDKKLFGKYLASYHVYVPEFSKDAYSFLIEKIFLGKREHFISTSSLLESWRVWNSVSSLKINPNNKLIYQRFDNLDVILKDHYLRFENQKPDKLKVLKRGRITSGSDEDIIKKLAEDFAAVVQSKSKLGLNTHVAFSGGNSPIRFFEYLSTVLKYKIDWNLVHIWQVDERCTQIESSSNFASIRDRLIDKVKIKYGCVHPMIYHFGSNCSNESLLQYQLQMKQLLVNYTFDYMVLGMGHDGHIASLFPNQPSLTDADKYVTISKSDIIPFTRMTLTYKVINSSKHLSILITGSEKKRKVLNKLFCENSCNKIQFPICGVTNSSIKWFINQSLLPECTTHDEL